MDDLIKKHLQDILTAIEKIESFFGDKPKLFEDFYSNLCLMSLRGNLKTRM